MMRRFLPLIFVLVSGAAWAADESTWGIFKSDTGLYQATIGDEHKTQTVLFPVGENLAVRSEQKSLVLDQRPYQNLIKSYVIKAEQTLGPELSKQEIDSYIDDTLNLYEKFYKARGALIQKKNREEVLGFRGGRFEAVFEDKEMGLQFVKAQIAYSETTKYQQVVTGNENMTTSYKTKDFMEGMKIDKYTQGPAVVKGLPLKEFVSPDELFLMHVPEINPRYFPAAPNVLHEPGKEIINLVFQDPVRNQKLFLNIYGYTFDKDLSFNDAKEIIAQRHIFKHLKSIEGLKIEKGFNTNNVPSLETSYPVSPTDISPFMNRASLKSYFHQGKMLVVELLGSTTMVNSDFAKYLVNDVKFLPAAQAASLSETAKP